MIAGKGDQEKELIKMNEGLNAGVEFLGNVKNTTKLFDDSSIFVIATRSSSEGFPISIIEAAFAKNLIISSKFLGLNSLFEDNIDGLTFKVDDYIDLANKIIYSIENPKLTKIMIENFYI